MFRVFLPLRPFEQYFQMTSTYISIISLVRPTKTLNNIPQACTNFPTWRSRYCFDILAPRRTWRYISHNSLFSDLSFIFQQPPLTCHVSWQRASAFLRLASASSCIETVELIDKLCLQSAPKNTLLLSQLNIYRIPEHIHTCSSSSSPSACAVEGGPNNESCWFQAM